MRKNSNWTFFALLVIVLQAISIYMIAALVLPDISGDALVDLREHFFAHRSWFFVALVCSNIFSLLKTLTLCGHLPSPVDSAFEFASCAAAIAGAVIRSEWFHRIWAAVWGLVFAVCVALLFTRLQSTAEADSFLDWCEVSTTGKRGGHARWTYQPQSVEHDVIPLDGAYMFQQGGIDSIGDWVALAEHPGDLPRLPIGLNLAKPEISAKWLMSMIGVSLMARRCS